MGALVAGVLEVGVLEVQPVAATRPSATSPIHEDLMHSILPVRAKAHSVSRRGACSGWERATTPGVDTRGNGSGDRLAAVLVHRVHELLAYGNRPGEALEAPGVRDRARDLLATRVMATDRG
jgi:hypothetical protein